MLCVCVLDQEESSVLASTALAVVQRTAVYLTVYSDYLTGLRESLSQPYRCRSCLKMSNAITDFV